VVTAPSHGSLSGVAPALTYTPDDMYFGLDSFTYVANDGTVESAPATVTIDIGSVNDAPEADDQQVQTDEDTALPITLTGSDPEGDELTYIIVQQPANGSLTGEAPGVTYLPNENYFGSDSFTFRTNDGLLDSDLATVEVTVNPVNDAPEPVDDSMTLNKGETSTELVGGAISVLENDTDFDGDTLVVSTVPVSDPLFGVLVLNSDGSFSYTHNDSFQESDQFVYEVCDDADPALCSDATVSISIDVGEKPEVIHADGFESSSL
jgi:hypothetical protein